VHWDNYWLQIIRNIKHFRWWKSTICVKGAADHFWFWLETNRSTFDNDLREKRFLDFRSQWTWPFDRRITPSFTSVRGNFPENIKLTFYHVSTLSERKVCARQTDTQTDKYHISAFSLLKCIRWYLYNPPLIILILVWRKSIHFDEYDYDMMKEFNVDSKADCGKLNLALVGRNKYTKETKTNKRQCPFGPFHSVGPTGWTVKAVRKESEDFIWRKGFVKARSFKSGVKGRGNDRWWERRWWLWQGDVCRMRWTRRRVNTKMAVPSTKANFSPNFKQTVFNF